MCPVVSAGKEKNIFFKGRCKNLLFNFQSFLSPKGPGFSDFGTATTGGGGGGGSLASSVTLLFED